MPTWDSLYESTKHPWGTVPISPVSTYLTVLSQGLTLDLGAGDGRNALPLAKAGGTVYAYDISSVAVAALNQVATELRQKNLIAFEQDLAHFQAPESFTNLIGSFMLHFLSDSQARSLIQQLQHATQPGGMHILMDFGPKAPFAKPGYFYPEIPELSALYQDWHLIELSETEVENRQLGAGHPVSAYTLVATKSPA